ncbi:TPA: hypothetical protein HA246_07220 [Candidatus Woesearchaeota archaeon]|nr:hypothetical protein [Candidatus Woesearchaeota archaeon]
MPGIFDDENLWYLDNSGLLRRESNSGTGDAIDPEPEDGETDQPVTCSINGPAAGGSDQDNEFNRDLLAAVLGENTAEAPKQKSAKDLVPQKIIIRDRCLQLGYMIGPETEKQGKRAYEVGGFFLLTMGDDTFSLRDFIVPVGLPVAEGSIFVAEQYDKTAREVKQRNQVNGTSYRLGAMLHVHPEKTGALRHSIPDDESLAKIVNKMAKTTRRIHEAPYRLIASHLRKEYGEDHLCLKGDELSDAVQRFFYPDDQAFYALLQEFGFTPDPQNFKKAEFLARLLEIIDAQTYEPRAINFAVSFVFNNGKEGPYVKVGIEEKFLLSGTRNYETVSDVPLEVIDKSIDIPTKREVADLVKRRVKFPKESRWVKGRGGIYVRKGVSYADTQYYGTFGAGALSLADRIANIASHLLTRSKREKPGVHQPNVPCEEVLEALVDGEVTGYSTPPIPTNIAGNTTGEDQCIRPLLAMEEVEKITDTGYDLEELTNLFVLSAFSYLAQYRNVNCRYSTYMAIVLDELGVYENRNPQVVVASPPELRGLRSSVKKIGPVIEDNPKLVEAHKLNFYKIITCSENILYELIANSTDEKGDETTINFMKGFIPADTIARNKLLEDYANAVLNEGAKTSLLPPQIKPNADKR